MEVVLQACSGGFCPVCCISAMRCGECVCRQPQPFCRMRAMVFRNTLLVLTVLLASCTAVRTQTADNAPRSVPMPGVASDGPVIGLALGGGGSRGFAHVGVIKALEEAGIAPHVVA